MNGDNPYGLAGVSRPPPTAETAPNQAQTDESSPVGGASYLEQAFGGSPPGETAADQSAVQPPIIDLPPPPPPTSPLSRLGNFFPVLIGGVVILTLLFLIITRVIPLLTQKAGPVTLTYWGLWEPESVMAGVLADYQRTHPKVTVNYQKQSAPEYRERLQSALSRTDGPDIFRIHNSWLPMFKNQLAPVPEKIYPKATYERTFYPAAKDDFGLGGKYYALPLEIDTLALFYNEDLLIQAGISAPVNWEQFKIAVGKIVAKDPVTGQIKIAGTAMGTTGNIEHWQEILALMFLQNGISDLSKADSTVLPDGHNAGVDVLTYYTGFASGNSLSRTWDETMDNSTLAFAAGRLAFYFGPSWEIFEIKELARNSNPGLNFKIAPVPQVDPDNPVNLAVYWAEAVNKKSRNTEEAWKFLQYLSSPEVMTKLYQAESNIRLFGEPYGRTEMADLLSADPFAGVFITQSKTAKTSALASRTFDGKTGLNSRISQYFEDAVNKVREGGSPQEALQTASKGTAQTLSDYSK